MFFRTYLHFQSRPKLEEAGLSRDQDGDNQDRKFIFQDLGFLIRLIYCQP